MPIFGSIVAFFVLLILFASFGLHWLWILPFLALCAWLETRGRDITINVKVNDE